MTELAETSATSSADSSIAAALVSLINDEVSLAADPVGVETDLLLSGAVDSLGVIRITQWMEDEYAIEVDPTDVTLENFQSVAKMAAYLSGQLDAS